VNRIRLAAAAAVTLAGLSLATSAETRDFSFQIYGGSAAGVPRLNGFVDNVPDLIGKIDPGAALIIFTEGNQFPVLLPLALDGFRHWLELNGKQATLRNDNIVVVTLPQGLVVSALEHGGIAFGAAIVPVDRATGLWPDVVMGGESPLRTLATDHIVEATAKRFARNRGIAMLVRAGNPLHLHTVADLANCSARVVLASPGEPGARKQCTDTVRLLGGPELSRTILAHEVADFPGRVGIQHRDVPYAIANTLADAGLIVRHLARYYAEAFPETFEALDLPGAERVFADIYVARAAEPRNLQAAALFLEYFFSQAAEVYPAGGFARLPDSEFGQTLSLIQK
jgi:accessory colonization factor AcfC